MPPVGFEPTISADEWPWTYALDRVATGTGNNNNNNNNNELPLVESFGLLNELFPFPSILGTGYPVLDLQLANVLLDFILP